MVLAALREIDLGDMVQTSTPQQTCRKKHDPEDWLSLNHKTSKHHNH